MNKSIEYLGEAKKRFVKLKGETEGSFLIRSLHDLEYIKKRVGKAIDIGVSEEACLMYIDGTIDDEKVWDDVDFDKEESCAYNSIVYSILHHKELLLFAPIIKAKIFSLMRIRKK